MNYASIIIMLLALVHEELTWTFNLSLMHVPCKLYLTKLKKALLRFCKSHVMKPEKEMLVLSNKSEIWAINS